MSSCSASLADNFEARRGPQKALSMAALQAVLTALKLDMEALHSHGRPFSCAVMTRSRSEGRASKPMWCAIPL